MATCCRCGRFLCDDCQRSLGGRTGLCEGCVQWLLLPPSAQSRWALGLACVTFLGVVPGVVGLVLARDEGRRILYGEAPVSGSPYLRLARAVFWLEVAGLGLLGLVAARL